MAVRVAVDTNLYADFSRGDVSVVKTLEMAEEVWLPFIVVGELRAGFSELRPGVIELLAFFPHSSSSFTSPLSAFAFSMIFSCSWPGTTS